MANSKNEKKDQDIGAGNKKKPIRIRSEYLLKDCGFGEHLSANKYKNRDIVSWYPSSGNLYPYELLEYYFSASIFRAVFDELIVQIVGTGFQVSDKYAQEYIRCVNNDGESLLAIAEKTYFNERLLGIGHILFIWDKQKKNVFIYAIDSYNCRYSTDKKQIIHNPTWKNRNYQDDIAINLYPSYTVKGDWFYSVVEVKKDFINPYYPMPYWISGKTSGEIPSLTDEYNKNLITRSLSVGAMLEVPMGTPDSVIEELKSRLGSHSGVAHAGDTPIIERGTDDRGNPIGLDFKFFELEKEANWREFHRQSKEDIHTNLRMPKSLMGDYDSAGFSKDKVENDRNQLLPLITSIQREFLAKVKYVLNDLNYCDIGDLVSNEMVEQSALQGKRKSEELMKYAEFFMDCWDSDQRRYVADLTFNYIRKNF